MEVSEELENNILYSTPDSCMCDYEACYLNVQGWCSAETFAEKQEMCERFQGKNENAK